jgi:2-amino-4-hydroxy-6-hydroxymethyldihydropteridine diphosphokinase
VEQVYIGLGSNVGDRERALRRAREALAARGLVPGPLSSLYLTEPVEAPPQDWFLNQVAAFAASLPPAEVLRACLAVEAEMGRTREVFRGPRTIDLDLLLHGGAVVSSPGLTVPHPRLHERRFVLVPLTEIAPSLVHPVLGLTMAELRARCRDTSRVLPWAVPAPR